MSIPKAYENSEFLHSSQAREIRILAEFSEPRYRLKRHGVEGTIVFFGSARTLSVADAKANLERVEREGGNPAQLRKAKGLVKVAPYYDDARELSRRLSLWSKEGSHGLTLCSGGGHGIMGACNQGAHDAGAPSVGFNISLPYEQSANEWITPELGFQFHYFFLRKFWFVNSARAIVVFPGGFGTLDEFMEVLTLVQTHKLERPLPIILYGREYWKKVIDLDAFADFAMIDADDVNLWHWSDSVDDAFEHLTTALKDVHLRIPKVGQESPTMGISPLDESALSSRK
ncbi:MAG: hypothetical protein RL318_3024 [Fibrobacterota bacterium]|jgi:uncharacterized protein (TIGR00730 family)